MGGLGLEFVGGVPTLQAETIGGDESGAVGAIEGRIDGDPFAQAEGAVGDLLQAGREVTGAGLGQERIEEAPAEVIMPVNVPDEVIGAQVVVMREHGRRLPGRAAQWAAVPGVANGFDEPGVEFVLHVPGPHHGANRAWGWRALAMGVCRTKGVQGNSIGLGHFFASTARSSSCWRKLRC